METRNYVPQLLAVLSAIRSLPTDKLPGIALKPAVRQLIFSSQIDLLQAQQKADVKSEAFTRLNAAYRRPYTPPDGPHRLLLPTDAAGRLEVALKKTPNLLAVRLKRYRIRPGDSLIRLARRFNTRPDELRRLNRLRSNTLIAGRTLLVPASSLSEQSAQHTKLARHRAPALRHRIRRGESLWTIARRYGVSVRQLARYNGLSVHRSLRPGQILDIPLRHAGRRPITHTVKPGENLWLLARRYGATVDALRRWNGLSAHPVLRPGQKLIILAARH
ncbi:LysM peptidoglycan-binding domain-containing protein [Sulfurivirga sp.]|uniref:lytic transglycosylase n=1 Tax=Sulfurivirga sp. TaxID=2614236 RepID=UPI0025D1B3BA|nr:LysM peptidoglycan-binding domain-containing protein [Sulfurivirga sp.]